MDLENSPPQPPPPPPPHENVRKHTKTALNDLHVLFIRLKRFINFSQTFVALYIIYIVDYIYKRVWPNIFHIEPKLLIQRFQLKFQLLVAQL